MSIATLTLVEDEGTHALGKTDPRVGYDPYDSGLVQRPKTRRTRNLRVSSKWIRVRNKPLAQPSST